MNEIIALVRQRVDFKMEQSDVSIQSAIDETVLELAKERLLTNKERMDLSIQVFNALRRLDILQPLLDDQDVTEIMVNGPEKIFIEKQGQIFKLDACFESQSKLEDIIQNIVSKVNRVVNESNPMVDARLKDGSRVNATLAPVALNGPILTIRKFPEKPLTIEQLIDWGSITREVADFLKKLVEAKYNIFVCGGTGSGKTTFLNVLSNFIPEDERIITIEDSAELRIVKVDNLVSLETRNANVEGTGQISMRDLIKTSLRMRPDRIVVGEVRGEEALDMLQAMNTGHDGSLSTGHANSCKDMLSRLETMVLMGADIPLNAIRQQIASALDIMIYLGRLRDRSRKVLEVSEIIAYKDGEILLRPLYQFTETSRSTKEKVVGGLRKTDHILKHQLKCHMAGISLD
ncbi:CpaF family protein [Vallitalea okinawensis]|uniref:CpaF family protein n=1 Tax=Vallitalea okinawensis TaxID=2078660 RepID=UPI000CFAAD1D